MYSASVVDSAMIGCFFELQDTAPPSIVKTYPEMECQCSWEAQSTSEKASRPPCEPPIMSFKSLVPFK